MKEIITVNVHATVLTSQNIILLCHCRESDNCAELSRDKLSDCLACLKPIHVWHHTVHEYKFVLTTKVLSNSYFLESLKTMNCNIRFHFECLFDYFLQGEAIKIVIINDEDLRQDLRELNIINSHEEA